MKRHFTPGNKANIKPLIYDAYLGKDVYCNCIQQQANVIKQGLNDPSQTTNMRISQLVTNSLGGRIVFGNSNKLDYEIIKPLRNKF